MTSQFANMTSSSIFWRFLFLLSSLVTGPCFTSISSLVLELWQFSYIRDWPEIWKSEIAPSEFCPIPGDWGELCTPNLTHMSLIKCYWMLQNVRFTAFTVSELLRLNQQERWGLQPPLPPGCPHRFHKNFQDISRTKWKTSRTKQQNQVQLKHSVSTYVKSIARTVTHISYTNNSDNCYIT